jgi:hypothetical protein
MTTTMQQIQKASAGILLVFFSFCFLQSPASAQKPIAPLRPPDSPIPLQYFGMHFHRLASTTPWPENVQLGGWRLLDAYVHWPNLEPTRDKWDFEKLDLYVKLAEQHHVTLMLPLVFTPQWASARPNEPSSFVPGNAGEPKDMADWQNYVRTVATRYKGRIHEYEVWNEPNLKEYYTGSIPQLVEMARIAFTTLKEIDPSVTVCSPSPTAMYGVDWLDRYLKAGGRSYADVIGYHFYVNPNAPETMVPLIREVQEVMERNGVSNKPLWDTETGWAIQNKQSLVRAASGTGFNSVVLSEELASSYLARSYVLSWASGVSRFYWYSWDNKIMGLTEEDGKTIKLPAQAYREVENWLIGARMTSCRSDEAGTWVCEIARNKGYRGWIVWNPNRPVEFRVPADWHVRNARELVGGTQNLGKDQRIQIGPTPLLLEYDGR